MNDSCLVASTFNDHWVRWSCFNSVIRLSVETSHFLTHYKMCLILFLSLKDHLWWALRREALVIQSVRKYKVSVKRHSYLVTSAFCSCWISLCRQHLLDRATWWEASDSASLEQRSFFTSSEKKGGGKVKFTKCSCWNSCVSCTLIMCMTVMVFHLPFVAVQVIFKAVLRTPASSEVGVCVLCECMFSVLNI